MSEILKYYKDLPTFRQRSPMETLMERNSKDNDTKANLDCFRENLALLEKKVSESVDLVLSNQKRNQKRLARYLEKLPIEDSHRKYIMTFFEKEQNRTQHNNLLAQELNMALQDVLAVLDHSIDKSE